MLFFRFRHSGRSAKIWLLLAGTLGVLSVACSDEEASPSAGNGGGGSGPQNTGGALRGDGLEQTPESDLNRRMLRPPSDNEINDALDDLFGRGGRSGVPVEPPDAAAPDATDAAPADGGGEPTPDSGPSDAVAPVDPPADASEGDTGGPA